MKRILTILLLLISCQVFGINYYIKTGGNDVYTGLSDAQAWGTITKVNTVWAAGTFAAGDSILFNRGDSFYGTIMITESGLLNNHIIISAYGTGNDPVIYGYTHIPSWTEYSTGIYSYNVACESATSNSVTVNGVNTAMGRFPNTGWNTYDSNVDDVSLTDNELTNTPNWTGAELVFRKSPWTLERVAITNHATTVLTYTPYETTWAAENGFGYFIQKSILSLDVLGEWYYNGTTFYMYFGANDPANYDVRISNLDKLITTNTVRNYITIDNLSFDGASVSTIELKASTHHWTIQNCTFNHAGKNAIDGYQTTHDLVIKNNTIRNSNNNAIRSIYQGYSNVVKNNVIDSTGMLMGHMSSDDEGGDAVVMKDQGTTTYDTITYNTITNTGHISIKVRYQKFYVAYNITDGFGMTKNDAGGLYTWGVNDVAFHKNIVINGYGDSGGIGTEPSFAPPDPYDGLIRGIYLDELSYNINVTDNIVANNRDCGILVQMDSIVVVTGNTVYNNGYYQIGLVQRYATNNYPIRFLSMSNNKFISKASGRTLFPYMQICLLAMTWEDHDIDEFGTFDNNIYARPIDQDDAIRTYEHNPFDPWNGTGYDVAGWKTYSGQDANSTGSLATVADTANIHFIYNPTLASKNYTLSAAMKDVANADYSGTITLQSFTALVLLGEGTITEAVPSSTTIITGSNGNPFILPDGNVLVFP